MESASGVLKIERAKRKDIKELVDLIYITEPEPQEEWGYGSEKEMKRNIVLFYNILLFYTIYQ